MLGGRIPDFINKSPCWASYLSGCRAPCNPPKAKAKSQQQASQTASQQLREQWIRPYTQAKDTITISRLIRADCLGMGHRLPQRRHQGPRLSYHKEGQAGPGSPNICERRDVVSHFGHSTTLCVRATKAILNHAPIGECKVRFHPQEPITRPCGESDLSKRVSTRPYPCLGDFIKFLTSNPTAFAFTPPRELPESADDLPYSEYQHEHRISPMCLGICSCYPFNFLLPFIVPFCLIFLRLLDQFRTFIRGLGLCRLPRTMYVHRVINCWNKTDTSISASMSMILGSWSRFVWRHS